MKKRNETIMEDLMNEEALRREKVEYVQKMLLDASLGKLNFENYFTRISTSTHNYETGENEHHSKMAVTSGLWANIINELQREGLDSIGYRIGVNPYYYAKQYMISTASAKEAKPLITRAKELENMPERDEMGLLEFEFEGRRYEFEASAKVAAHLQLGDAIEGIRGIKYTLDRDIPNIEAERERRDNIALVQDILMEYSLGKTVLDDHFSQISTHGKQIRSDKYVVSELEGKIVHLLGKGIDREHAFSNTYMISQAKEEDTQALREKSKELDGLTDGDEMGTLRFRFRGHDYEFQASKRVAEHLKLGDDKLIKFEFTTNRERATRRLEFVRQSGVLDPARKQFEAEKRESDLLKAWKRHFPHTQDKGISSMSEK